MKFKELIWYQGLNHRYSNDLKWVNGKSRNFVNVYEKGDNVYEIAEWPHNTEFYVAGNLDKAALCCWLTQLTPRGKP